MSLIERVRYMFGLTNGSGKNKQNYIGPEVSRAVERNERASQQAREALEHLRMTETLRDIAGKMK